MGDRRVALIVVAAVVSSLVVLATSAFLLIADEDPDGIQRAVTGVCANADDGERITLFEPVGDDWIIRWAAGPVDTAGRSPEEVIGLYASDAYPGSEDIYDQAAQAIADDQPVTLTTVFNETAITTQIVPLAGGRIVALCTTIDPQENPT